MARKAARRTLQLKVTLVGVKPPIWRRLLVPGDVSLRRFHDILQIAFGWTDSHLHMFQVGEDNYGFPVPGGDADWIKNDAHVKVGRVLAKANDSLVYEYDFGDSWNHQVVVEKVISGSESPKVPRCIAGERACPPEDCGGVWGYAEFLNAIGNRGHPEHEEMLEWVGGAFDPEHFDIDAVNDELAEQLGGA